jgi:hypothetical protein
MRLLCISPVIFIADTQQRGSRLLQPSPTQRPLWVVSSQSRLDQLTSGVCVSYRPEAAIREFQISGKKKPAEAGFWNLH